jgi:hypothetical protein
MRTVSNMRTVSKLQVYHFDDPMGTGGHAPISTDER